MDGDCDGCVKAILTACVLRDVREGLVGRVEGRFIQRPQVVANWRLEIPDLSDSKLINFSFQICEDE
ncbi:hypothetical protein J6590_006124 [Homalodisca vitripennis]|nr:hypothetical protein J6590_006124 [Homalodisca vitripennis]